MLAPDYQEFANWPVAGYPWQSRDLHIYPWVSGRNRRNVARLPRPAAGTKAELSSQTGPKRTASRPFPNSQRPLTEV